MTTSGPQADRRDDDDSREHRSIGQRIRDAVLGDPDDDRRDAPGGYADRGDDAERARGAGEGAPGYADSGHDAGEGAPGYAGHADGLVAGRTEPERHADPDRGGSASGIGHADPDRDAVERAGSQPGRMQGGVEHGGLEHGGLGRDEVGRGEVGRGEVGRGEVGRGEVGRGEVGAGGDRDYAPYEQAMREHAQGGAVPDPVRDDVTQEGASRSVGGRTGYDDRDVAGAPAGQPGYDDRGGQVDGTYAGIRGTAGDTGTGAGRDAAPGDRDLVTSSYDPDRDRGYDPQAAGTAMAGSGAAAAAGATGTTHDAGLTEHGGAHDARQHDTRGAGDYDSRGYDPATDTGYPGEGRSDADRAVGHRDADYDTGRVDAGPRDFADRDLGDEGTRAGSFADHDLEGRGTGTRDTGTRDFADHDLGDRDTRAGSFADHDLEGRGTGTHDSGHRDSGDRGSGDRGSGHGVGAGVAAVAGGALAAAGAAVTRHRGDRDDDRGGDDRGGDRFSPVDDTATVDPSPTGRATTAGTGGAAAGTVGAAAGTRGGGQDTAADHRAEAVADDSRESEGSEGGRERLVPVERAHDYSSRWDALKGDFVDEPRRAVAQADDLVGELLDEIQRLFADQRRDLEQGFDHDRASTEDLRLALRRYRSFFDRLLSF